LLSAASVIGFVLNWLVLCKDPNLVDGGVMH